MGVNVWRCHYCETALPIGQAVCDKCKKERETETETRISLGDITYAREEVGLGPTGIELFHTGHFGQRAISCEHIPQALQDQLVEFVKGKEEARDKRREEARRKR